MSVIKANGAGDQSLGFYNGVATQSLRFDDGSSHKLTKDFSGSSPDNDKKMTISVWAKRGNLSGSNQVIIANYNSVRFLGELMWNTDNKISFDPGGNGNGASNSYQVRTTALFRDVSSWYHIVLAYDSTQSTDTNRVKLYVNGTQQTLTAPSGNTFPPLNYAHLYSYAGANNTIGEFGAGFNSGYLDGYLSEFNFIDGLTLDPTYFGETKNGVWIAKKYTGSYGTNGYRLQFIGTGTSTSSGSVTNPTNIGDDSSGNNNHFAVSGLASTDANIPDSPENNFCTWNPLSASASSGSVKTLSEGNLQFSGGAFGVVGGTMAVTSGKWYWETKLLSTVDGSNPFVIGFVSATSIAHSSSHDQSVVMYSDNGTGKLIQHIENSSITQNITIPSALLTFDVNDVMQFAYDGDTGKIWVGKNNTYVANDGGTDGNPSSGSNQTFTLADTTIPMTPLADHGGVAWTGLANFGQLTNAYTAPTDFNALSTANLPEPTISPAQTTQAVNHFGILTWTGNGTSDSSTNNIRSGGSGVGGEIDFKPDWTWVKSRSHGQNHNSYDSNRGAGIVLYPNLGNDEDDTSTYFTSFQDKGFNLARNGGDTNANNYTYVGWNWKANGAQTSTIAVDSVSSGVPSIASTVQANTTAGFSIVTWTNTSSNNQKIAHGLGVAPTYIIAKSRSTSSSAWVIGHSASSFNWTNDYYQFDTGQRRTDGGGTVFGATPDQNVFTFGTGAGGNGVTFVAYCFAEIEGYSKFGSYTGNGNDDGTFVYTGFRPAWVMIKRTDTTSNWAIFDRNRDPINAGGRELFANVSNAEQSHSEDWDFVSNGIKFRRNYTDNSSGGTFIYMAFAEVPFKYANAR